MISRVLHRRAATLTHSLAEFGKLLENELGESHSGKCLSPLQSIYSRHANDVPHYNFHETKSCSCQTRPCPADLPGIRVQIGSMLIPTFSELPVCLSFAAVENFDRYFEARKSLLLSTEYGDFVSAADGYRWFHPR